MIDDFKPVDDRREAPIKKNTTTLSNDDAATTQPFRTPAQIAAESEDGPGQPLNSTNPIDMTLTKKTKKRHWPPTKKQLYIAIAFIVVVGLGSSAYALLRKPPKKTVALATPKPAAVVKKPVITTVASNLTGLPVSPATNSLPVTGAMIENTTFARPQAGLSQAGVVFEAVAEGGVTRFLALFQDQQPTNIGPIRSVRPYYISWAMGFQAALAHVGGSPDGLADMSAWGARNLDEFSNGSFYHRITSRDAPHNVYTGVPTLIQLEESKGYTTSTFAVWPRKADKPLAQPTAKAISMQLSGPDYNVAYAYNASKNSYDRSEGGAAQIDANTNTQLSPKVVIAMVVPETQGSLDSTNAYYSDYTVTGSGSAYVFQDGGVTQAQWQKADNNGQLTFTTTSGAPLPFDAGQTWITAITSPSNVSYTP